MPKAREPAIELVEVNREFSADDLEVVLIHPCVGDIRSRVDVAVIGGKDVNKHGADQTDKQDSRSAVIGDRMACQSLF